METVQNPPPECQAAGRMAFMGTRLFIRHSAQREGGRGSDGFENAPIHRHLIEQPMLAV